MVLKFANSKHFAINSIKVYKCLLFELNILTLLNSILQIPPTYLKDCPQYSRKFFPENLPITSTCYLSSTDNFDVLSLTSGFATTHVVVSERHPITY